VPRLCNSSQPTKMSSRSTVRLPISIPEQLQNKFYTIKVGFSPVLNDGSMSKDMEAFKEETLRPEDLEGSSPDAKTLVLNRSDITSFSKSSERTEAVGAKVYLWTGSKLIQVSEYCPV